ncbi:MAG: 50S ribosomal protein L1 [Spirochaetaceae bacterium]|nr:50S ribosomal protein L1 [Spirochaetaceae bacterium]
MKHGKKYVEAVKKVDASKAYPLAEALELVKQVKYAKFDETVEIHVNLKMSKSHTVRDTVVLPNQFKGEKRVLVFCKEDRIKEALDAGAAYAGADEYITKVKDGWLDFDVAVATPDMMKDVGRLGMVLGRKGLMPNPKTGTVTTDIAAAIAELKKGRSEYRADKTGIVHFAIGKVSMDTGKISENAESILSELVRKKPADVKGEWIRSISVNSTMGPGVWVEHKEGV